MEITVKLTGLDALTAAVSDLAKMMAPIPVDQEEPVAPEVPAPAPAPAPIPAPTAVPVAGVPVAAAPTYTVEQIMAAGATLMDAGKANELVALLHSFGVQAVMDLKPDQLGMFATKMRELGAKI